MCAARRESYLGDHRHFTKSGDDFTGVVETPGAHVKTKIAS
jgi:hypothetical protein